MGGSQPDLTWQPTSVDCMVMVTEKTCADCGATKSISGFHKVKPGETIGCWRSVCKPCANARSRAYAAAHPEQRRLINKSSYQRIGKEKAAWYRRRMYWRRKLAKDPTATFDPVTFRNPILPLTTEGKRLRQRRYTLKYGWGLTLAAYEAMLERQGRCCAACRTDTPGGKGAFIIDHDHVTGAVRGLLCNRCNLALGLLKDDETRLLALIQYLRTHRVAIPA